ncbi:MAG: glycerol-3-phosphate 1-O-acyltransferase PlsY [Methylophilaceae bacterium]|nr:glycerol-3-phosphate 1-O-acyltransferase PlsY [Methylophilaceae bacterium]
MNELGLVSVTLIPIVWVILAYLIGSISFGILVSRLYRLPDPRTIGSGNLGATNVARSGSKSAGLLTLFGDSFKGWLPVWLAIQSNMLIWVVCAIGLAVFLGHLYPIYHNFKGGKGAATALGGIAALSPLLSVLILATWFIVLMLTRYVSVASIAASISAVIYMHWLLPYDDYKKTIFIVSILIIWRHRANIQRLWQGTEHQWGKTHQQPSKK